MATVVKIVFHEDRGKWVVNMPGSGREPRVFTNRERAMAYADRLTP